MIFLALYYLDLIFLEILIIIPKNFLNFKITNSPRDYLLLAEQLLCNFILRKRERIIYG